jgi:exosortase family protein XrtF
MSWAEIKPSFFFLARFLAFYLVVNFLYGWWVTAYEPGPDPATVSATHQATFLLHVAGYDVKNVRHSSKAAERILLVEKSVLSVYEGCNGINVWIIFVGFVFAFSGISWRVAAFLLVGSVIIHLANLGRIIFLFFISLNYPDALYFFHKYFFTAGLYLIVFVMWYYWITRYGKAVPKSE